MTVGQLKNLILIIPDDVEVEADTEWECGPVPLGKGYLIKDSLIFIHDGDENQEREYEAKLKAEQPKCMDLPKVSIHGANKPDIALGVGRGGLHVPAELYFAMKNGK